MSKGKAIVLGVFTFWPILYIFLFIGFVFTVMISDVSHPRHGSSMGIIFPVIFTVHVLTILGTFVLITIYMVYLFRTDRVPKDKKALWAAVLFLGNMGAMPVFWYLYIWRKPKADSPVPSTTLVEGSPGANLPSGKRHPTWLKALIIALVIIILGPVLLRAVSGWVMQARFDGKLAELHKVGEPLTLSELTPPSVATDQNAALLYEQASAKVALLPGKTVERIETLAGRGRKLSPEELKEVRELLPGVAEALALVHEAASRRCRFDADYKSGFFDRELPHLKVLQTAWRLLALNTAVLLADGKADEAADECLRMLRVARAVDDEPFFISWLVENALEGQASSYLQCVMDRSEPSVGALKRFAAELGDLTDRRRIVLAMRGERADYLPLVERGFRIPADFEMCGRLPAETTGFKGFLFRPVFMSDAVTWVEFESRALQLAQKPWFETASLWKKLEQDRDTLVNASPWAASLHPYTYYFIRGQDQFARNFDRGVASRGLAKLAIALRVRRMAQGSYPASLADLVPSFLDTLPTDPFSGKSCIFRREKGGFLVYSVGDDGKDNGGVEKIKDSDERDIVWKCSR